MNHRKMQAKFCREIGKGKSGVWTQELPVSHMFLLGPFWVGDITAAYNGSFDYHCPREKSTSNYW